MSTEGAYWALKGKALTAGITPARMGQLAKLCNDFERAHRILQEVLKAKNPSSYLGAICSKIRDELKTPQEILSSRDRTQEPEIALQGRLSGWPVRKTALSNGKPGWWVAGTLYDQEGNCVGA